MTSRRLATIALATLVAACSADPPAKGPVPVFALDGASTASGALGVRIRVPGVAAQRRLTALAADVDRLEVHAVSGTASRMESIGRAAFASGAASLTLADLVPGSYSVRIAALDAGGRTIGRRTLVASVSAGRTTDLDVDIPLAPTPTVPFVHQPSPHASDAARFAGLAAAIAFQTAPPVRYPTIEAQYEAGIPGIDASSVALTADGSAWATVGIPNLDQVGSPPPSWGRFVRITPAGGVVDLTPAHPPESATAPFKPLYARSAPGGNRVLLGQPGLNPDATYVPSGYVYDAAAQPVAPSGFKTVGEAAIDTNGHVWAVPAFTTSPNGQGRVVRHEAGLTSPRAIETLGAGFQAKAFACTRDGHMWMYQFTDLALQVRGAFNLYGPGGERLLSVPATGAMEASFGGGRSLACDGAGNLWCPGSDRRRAFKVSRQGAFLAEARGSLEFSNMYVDPHDHVWAYNRALVYDYPDAEHATQTRDHGMVTRFAPDGTLVGYYHLGTDVHILDLAVAADGTMWVATARTGLLKVKVDAPVTP